MAIYKVFASLREDLNEGWVWLKKSNVPPRSIICIKNKTNNKKIYCEALQIDDNYLKIYNNSPRKIICDPDNAIVINGWYRRLLGNIITKQDHELLIVEANYFWGKMRAAQQHPQLVVRLAIWMAILSIILGVFSLFK